MAMICFFFSGHSG